MNQTADITKLLTAAKTWIETDPDPETRSELQKLVDEISLNPPNNPNTAALTQLAARFSGPLNFGTAGLRGPIAAGESAMNTAVVIRTTAGLMTYLKEKTDKPRVVVGCDARHGSAKFFQAAAEVISAAGGEALQLPPQLPTPVTAFAVRHLNADAGIMITASHNPPDDNGYKVYLGGAAIDETGRGCQIVPPADSEIAKHIATRAPANQIPRNTNNIIPVDVREQYLQAATQGFPPPESCLKIVLTPMHGVGGKLAKEAFTRAGFTDVTLVSSQAEPDPDFPTVSFPNPEEPGALNEASTVAAQIGADLIIALDPDADRCAVAIPQLDENRNHTGKNTQLSGDQTGILLGDYLADIWRSENPQGKGALAASIVSSRMLNRIAETYQMDFKATLTGFKWISRVPHLVFGYEEAIGFCTAPQYVADKDGISAALNFARLAAKLKASGSDVEKQLEKLYRQHGCYISSPLTFRVKDLSLISRGMNNLNTNPPQTLAGSPITEVTDLSQGYQGLAPTTGIMLLSAADDRVIVRPSGTEPKLKCYLEVVMPVKNDSPLPIEQARKRLESIKKDLTIAIGI